MPQGHVGDFVRHHPGQLRFVFGRLDGAAIQVEETARQRKSVDGFLVDRFELVRIAVAGCVANQARAQPVQVVIDRLVLQRWQLFFGVLGCLAAELDVLLFAEHVPARLYARPLIGFCGRLGVERQGEQEHCQQPGQAALPRRAGLASFVFQRAHCQIPSSTLSKMTHSAAALRPFCHNFSANCSFHFWAGFREEFVRANRPLFVKPQHAGEVA